MPEYVPITARKHRRRLFAQKYVQNGFNPTQAVIDCGWTTNRNSAHVIGYRLLRTVTAQNAIVKQLMESKLTADQVLERLSRFAGVDFNSNEIKPEHAIKTLELLGKAHKLFVDKVETTDTSQRDGIAEGLQKSIESAVKRDNVDDISAAIGLYDALCDDPTFSEVKSWPIQYQAVITEHLAEKSRPVVDGGEQ